jgi:N-acetylneuraminic acid mutarotase
VKTKRTGEKQNRTSSKQEKEIMKTSPWFNRTRFSSIVRIASAATLIFSCVVVAVSSAINLTNHPPNFPVPQNNTAFSVNGQESAASLAASAIQRDQALTFADRVAYQRAIEDVYWRHRIWAKANPGPKPPLEKVMSQAQIEKKVEDYLRNSQALEDYWQRPITPDQLQAEMERIASHTKQPGVLREIFATLGDDPFVIAECLARPVLAERLVAQLYAHDQRFHGELKRRAEAELRMHPSVKQLKQTSGMYTEMEWIKNDSVQAAPASADTGNIEAVKMSGDEWQESVEKLAQEFSNAKEGDAWGQIKTGVLSPLQEDESHYYAVAVMGRGKDRLKLATVAWLKKPLRSWLAKAETQAPVTMAAVSANYALPTISTDSPDNCTDDTWTVTSTTGAPAIRYYHTAVWTGSEMIVWGGFNGSNLNSGGRYDPSTDSWTATSTTNAPTARLVHTAVWTGNEMIVWGGFNVSYLNTGGRYNPSTDSWTATSTTNAPSAREEHTAVWTGSQMIVWGGYPDLNTGGRYNPSTDSWTATSTTGAPEGRHLHTAVWTDTEMIVWGGLACCLENVERDLNTGGRYNPITDSWIATSTSNAPDARSRHTAVWTRTEMIVWGGDNGFFLHTGGRYDPSTDSWTATSTTGAPAGRDYHTAVWTGSEMIVWGGCNGLGCLNALNTGGRYNPGTDIWTATSTTGAPAVRYYHTAVWTGSEMIVWGGNGNSGYLNTGGRYCAQSGAPTITLSAAGRKVGGINRVRLTWSGATSVNIDVYRNAVLIVTTANDGSYIDSTGDTGRARYTYQVCEAGTATCSNDVTVTFRH